VLRVRNEFQSTGRAGRTIVNPDCFGEESEEKTVALA